MAEKFKALFGFILRNPINILAIVILGYCIVQLYVLGNTSIGIKATMFATAAIWIVLFVAKNLLKILILLVIAGGLFYVYHSYASRDKIACEESGGFWNENTLSCDEKTGFWERLNKMFEISKK